MDTKTASGTTMHGVNTGVEHGKWGEETAARMLRSKGYSILERNARPCAKDRRLEIDIVARDNPYGTIVFVEVKQHAHSDGRNGRLRSINRRKKSLLLRACRAWLAKHHWCGPYRFDVVEVYGTPGDSPKTVLDHIERVRLFSCREKFVNWYK